MKRGSFFYFFLLTVNLQAQLNKTKQAKVNIRLSFLVFPSFTPLMSVETSILKNLTLQGETNFKNTHGFNLKYFIKERMANDYVFVGMAFLNSKDLNNNKSLVYLPYVGYGYAYCFGKKNNWVFDSRAGFGKTINANNNLFLPILKTGIGRRF